MIPPSCGQYQLKDYLNVVLFIQRSTISMAGKVGILFVLCLMVSHVMPSVH